MGSSFPRDGRDQPPPQSEPSDRELIDAMNLIGEYVTNHLADGWQITIYCDKNGMAVGLEDEFANDVQAEVERDVSLLRSMCERSHDPDYRPWGM